MDSTYDRFYVADTVAYVPLLGEMFHTFEFHPHQFYCARCVVVTTGGAWPAVQYSTVSLAILLVGCDYLLTYPTLTVPDYVQR